ncbi:hypothetical protein GE09DRAFT_128002 [Coniochaeta sp. 2T2.1]|nr:hypothetical protein GE09DRAFT_128002 [Coniochaeta sp. 2T2.1]
MNIITSLLLLSLSLLFLNPSLANPLGLTTTSPHHTITTTTTTFTLPTATVNVPGLHATTATSHPEAEVTASPNPSDANLEEDDAAARLRLTTYWSCVQQPGVATAHCGWHRPVVDASMPNAAGRTGTGRGRGTAVVVAVGMAVGVVVGL